ncbi:MAG: carboxypeptidase regulatory-like domain-containing protein [Bryobacteraceae bacterium]
MLRVRVIGPDFKGRSAVVLAPEGGGSPSGPSDDTGFTVVPFTYDREPPYKLSILVKLPRDLYIVSPCDAQVPVPRCTDTQCFERVMLLRPGEQFQPPGLRAIGASISRASAPRLVDHDPEEGLRSEALKQIAARVRGEPAEIDGRIRNWAAKASDPDDRAFAALYVREWAAAEQQFNALASRAAPDQRSDFLERSAVASYRRGKFADSAAHARSAAALEPADQETLNLWGLALLKAGETDRGETVLRASADPASLYNLAHVRLESGDKIAAIALLKKALDEASSAMIALQTQYRIATIQNSGGVLLGWIPLRFWPVVLYGALLLFGIWLLYLLISTIRRWRGGQPVEQLRKTDLEYSLQEDDSESDELELEPVSRSRTFLTVAVVTGILAVAGIFLFTTFSRTRQDGPRPVAGLVTDGAGHPVAGAVIQLVGSATKTASTGEGAFRLPRPPEADRSVLLRVSAPGYDPMIEFLEPSVDRITFKLEAARP